MSSTIRSPTRRGTGRSTHRLGRAAPSKTRRSSPRLSSILASGWLASPTRNSTRGFWYLVSASCSSLMVTLGEPGVPLATRLRAVRSFVPLFEQVMAVRCSPQSLPPRRGVRQPAQLGVLHVVGHPADFRPAPRRLVQPGSMPKFSASFHNSSPFRMTLAVRARSTASASGIFTIHASRISLTDGWHEHPVCGPRSSPTPRRAKIGMVQ